MAESEVASNTGPIIALAHIGQIEILHRVFGQILIPVAVRAEIQDETSLAALNKADWIVVRQAKDTLAAQLLREELDAGESETIVLASLSRRFRPGGTPSGADITG